MRSSSTQAVSLHHHRQAASVRQFKHLHSTLCCLLQRQRWRICMPIFCSTRLGRNTGPNPLIFAFRTDKTDYISDVSSQILGSTEDSIRWPSLPRIGLPQSALYNRSRLLSLQLLSCNAFLYYIVQTISKLEDPWSVDPATESTVDRTR